MRIAAAIERIGLLFMERRLGFDTGGVKALGSTRLREREYHWAFNMRIEIEQEVDGRWPGEIPDLPGVMVYGATREEAVARVRALALHVLADRLEHGESLV
jgi:predicted RNase H-like HicB family nuclease